MIDEDRECTSDMQGYKGWAGKRWWLIGGDVLCKVNFWSEGWGWGWGRGRRGVLEFVWLGERVRKNIERLNVGERWSLQTLFIDIKE